MFGNVYLGGKFVPTRETKKKKQGGKVVRLGDDLYSVHTNQVYRTVCHVPLGNHCVAINWLSNYVSLA